MARIHGTNFGTKMDIDTCEPQSELGASVGTSSPGCTSDAEPTLLPSGATYEELNRLINAIMIEHPSFDMAFELA